MHGFLSLLPHNFVSYALFGLVISFVGLAAALLFTRKNSKAREWLFAEGHRIEAVGLSILMLVWLGFFIYNRVTGT